jgi:UDP-perosamine 4-acetyltransferase
MKRCLLVGGGGHARSVLAVARETKRSSIRITGIVDASLPKGTRIDGIPVVGTDSDLEALRKDYSFAFIAVGSVGDATRRTELFALCRKFGFGFPVFVSASAVVDRGAVLGAGTVVMRNAVVNCGSKIGENVILNTACIVEHDCVIADNVHIAPGAVLSAAVEIGEGSHIGTGSAVIQGVRIGARSLIGAGSAVVKDIASGVRAWGNPCVVRDGSDA